MSSSRRTRHAHALCFLLLTPMLVPRAAAVAAEGSASTGCLPYSRSIAQVTVVSPARHNGAARRAAQAASCTLTVSSRRPSWTLWPPPNISSPWRHDASGPPPPGVGCQLEAAVRCKPPSVLPRPWRRGRAAAALAGRGCEAPGRWRAGEGSEGHGGSRQPWLSVRLSWQHGSALRASLARQHWHPPVARGHMHPPRPHPRPRPSLIHY